MSDFAKGDWCFSIPDRNTGKPSIVGKAKDLPSQQPDMDTGMEDEDKLAEANHSRAPTVGDNGHDLKKPLFKVWIDSYPPSNAHYKNSKLNPKEKIAAATEAAAYLSREKVSVRTSSVPCISLFEFGSC